ncbi:hypothetical protein DB35_25400 [Streptomyces abyssalis]|uniref:SIP-like Rossmann fold domain-containing protein n=1 Tax=Streptomyces abyssalis TaxID=933944 RepID=A0A1E7JN29_9ACTN|nr:SIP domain-containing protein [Streptomyces abyssalis]OEU86926.1 hypothetical protein DB35_25400 [Streptomyces abyssalis]OEU89689.1 hypothetical protein AN215_08165 [Streptomyces abyssalis]OEV31300.1 hypothetical protein AN219_05525 [Streptomyces nanshensis]
MARVPKVLADYAERRGFTTSVTSVERPSPSLLRVTFQSPSLKSRSVSPCDVTAFRVRGSEFRHYTPELHDPDAGTVTVLFHHHGRTGAPGLALIESLVPGEEIIWCGLESARSFRWTSPGAALAMGDASTLGLMAGLTERANAEGARLLVAVETEPPDCDYVRTLLPGAVVLAAGEEHGAALDEWLSGAGEHVRALAPQTVYLAGHGGSIQRQRDVLRTRYGLDRRAVRTQPYWATGRTGL